jgi:hypothetical protein
MNSRTQAILLAALFAAAPASPAIADEPSRQDTVRERSADVMPFDMNATKHVFTKTATGGIQRVVTKDPGDTKQIELIRIHLTEIAEKFRRRDFSGPLHVHGAAMPGLAVLQNAATGEIDTGYRNIASGAEIRYSSSNPKIVDALHQWFDAQLSDHGPDAMAGHDHSMQHRQ